jgi:hypothetical protein
LTSNAIPRAANPILSILAYAETSSMAIRFPDCDST